MKSINVEDLLYGGSFNLQLALEGARKFQHAAALTCM
jgi:hypothetical protein